MVKLPQGRTVRFTEQTPKPENANSAVAVSLQVGSGYMQVLHPKSDGGGNLDVVHSYRYLLCGLGG